MTGRQTNGFGGVARWASAFVVAAVLCITFGVELLPFRGPLLDFASFFLAAGAVDRGLDPYDIDVLRSLARAAGHQAAVYPYVYPPSVAHLLAPVASLSPARVQQVAWLVCVGCAAVATAASVSLARSASNDTPAHGALLAALIVLLLPFDNELALGQINVAVVALVACAVVAYRHRADVPAGALVGFAAALKATPAIVVLFFAVRGRWRAVAGGAAAFGAVVLATLPFGGAKTWLSFLQHLPSFAPGAHVAGLFEPATIFNFSPAGFFARSLGSSALVRPLAILFALLALAAALAVARRVQSDQQERLALASLLVVPLFVAPLTYVHHIVFLAPSAAIWLGTLRDRKSTAGLVLMLALLTAASTDFPFLYERIGLMPGGRPVFGLTSLNLLALLALFLFGIVLGARSDATAGPSR